MNDLPTMTAQPRPLEANGRTYMVHPLDVTELGQLQVWVDSRQPDPFALVADQLGTGRFTMAQEQHLLKSAIEVSQKPKPPIGTPEADRHLLSLEGVKKIFALCVRKGDPKFTDAEADALFDAIGLTRAAQILNFAALDQVVGDPKAGEAGGGATTASPP